MHPDAVVFPERWKGRRYWVSATPYPTGNPKYENPSIYQGYRATQMFVFCSRQEGRWTTVSMRAA